MFERAKSIATAATVGGLCGAYTLTQIFLQFEDEDASLEDSLRFLARSHATLSTLTDLIEHVYEDSIRDGELTLPNARSMRKIKKQLRRLWLDDDVADSVGQMLLRGRDFHVH